VVKAQGSRKKELNNYLKYYKKTGKYLFFRFFYFILVVKYLRISKFYLTIFTEMKKNFLIIILLAMFLFSCAKGITPYEAAHGKAKCGRYLK